MFSAIELTSLPSPLSVSTTRVICLPLAAIPRSLSMNLLMRASQESTRSGSFFFLVNSRKGGLGVYFFEDGFRVRPLHLRTTATSWVSRRFLGWSYHFNLAA